jgi:hypothetical protein
MNLIDIDNMTEKPEQPIDKGKGNEEPENPSLTTY